MILHLIPKKTIAVLLLSAGLLCLSGCGEDTEKYDQAVQDLEQGNYEYALTGFEECIAEGLFPERSCRGAGLCCLRQTEYKKAAEYFTDALNCDNVEKTMQQDLLSYRATAYLKAGEYDNAMADCQTLAMDFEKTGDICFLTGSVALAMDAYDEAAQEFDQAYAKTPDYDMAIRIYEEYIVRGMEADGTRYLEQSLVNDPKTAEDYCERGRIYYYMEDYDQASQELIEAMNRESVEARLLLGMVYLAKHDIPNAKAMYTDYLSINENSGKGYNGLALCALEENDYEGALKNIRKGIPEATTEEMQSLLFNEIVVYERMLDFATAEDKAEEYVSMFPEDTAVRRELAFLQSRTALMGIVQTSEGTEEQTDDGTME